MNPELKREFARDVVATLRRAGHTALWAGGCVRDLLLGVTPDDYDVATDAIPKAVMRLFPRTVPVGVSFGVVRVLGPKGAGEIEVATFRSDGEYRDGRRPETVVFGTPREDAIRRDFTINGMFLDPDTDEVIDYVGGREDLSRGVIRAIGDPRERFNEDKLRLLRAIRFTARFGFALDPATRAAVEEMAPQVCQVAAERIAQELKKMLGNLNRAFGLKLCREVGLLAAIFPDLRLLDPSLDCLPLACPFPVALAALLHPLGAHAAESACRDLRLSNEETERVTWILAHIGRVVRLEDETPCTRKQLLSHPGAGDLLVLARAIAIAGGSGLGAVEFAERYRSEEPEGPLDPPPLLKGSDLIRLGHRPGPRFSGILRRIREAQLNGEVADADAATDLLRREFPRPEADG